jgi:hypothetical protein
MVDQNLKVAESYIINIYGNDACCSAVTKTVWLEREVLILLDKISKML